MNYKVNYVNNLDNREEKIDIKKVQEAYNNPIPIAAINNFWGIDSKILKFDETVQIQSFDQNYKNFWSFIDFNQNLSSNINIHPQFSSSSKTFITRKSPYNTMSYAEARQKIDKMQ